MVSFFEALNRDGSFANIPIHAEFRLSEVGQLMPIEFNPMRFGGFAYTDLVNYAYGFNPYQAFFEGFEPDWSQIWNSRQNNHYAFVLGYNGTEIDIARFEPRHDLFKKQFEQCLAYYEVDSRSNPCFAIAYIQEKSREGLEPILNLEFRDFFQRV